MSLENETTSDTATFKHFDREWTVPNKRHLSHMAFMRDATRLGVGSLDMMIAECFLSPRVSSRNQQEPNQWLALLEIDPDEADLDAFSSALSKALGLGDSGNS